MKYVYRFSEGSKEMKDLLGGKGANLAEMTNLGLPVPTGFTITTDACINYLKENNTLNDNIKTQIKLSIKVMETYSDKKLNSPNNPLLVSVRSGAKFSMPGMMDTILNLGLNDETVTGLAKKTGNEAFAYDCYRRLLQMFGDVVFGLDKHIFEEQLDILKEEKDYKEDRELEIDDLKRLVNIYKEIYLEILRVPFPQNPAEQLFLAIEAVFRSWLNPRAKIYRKLNKISEDLGTAVNIQEMVFGNSGLTSGTGVAFTRNPSTGEKGLFGEFLLNAQGEDVVAGIRTPKLIEELKQIMPNVYNEFLQIASFLENHYKDMQDIEFTIENQKLFILQTRNGKRTPKAAFKIASSLVHENQLTKSEAILRIDTDMINHILHPIFKTEQLSKAKEFMRGLPASPGAATGKVYFNAESAKIAKEKGEQVILFRHETSPEDIEGMVVSQAIVTSRGGMTSHAAVVARGMGICCVVGCEALKINETLNQADYPGGTILEGDEISVDGSTGKIYKGILRKESVEEETSLMELLNWSDDIADMGVRANAETLRDIKTAISFGAKGIGLARTEHMFFGEDRILQMRKLILSETSTERLTPLKILKQIQKEDFKQIYRLTKNLPTTIRLLDPPLHEFLPTTETEIKELAGALNISEGAIKERITTLHEVNPMLGHRGCRLAVTYPEIYIMQVEAIIESAIEINEELSLNIIPEIMIPLIGLNEELILIKSQVEKTIKDILTEKNVQLEYKIGTMIEIPRACLIADKIADSADFFSFGTNDLTQMTFGYSRDDIGKFMGEYIDKNLLVKDPFQSIDIDGVGELMKIGVANGRKIKETLKIGVCGEVGGDPESIKYFQQLGLSYVSCSPYRIPIARLAVAQASLIK